MLIEYLRYGSLHNWAVFCCTVATLGLVGAAFASVGTCFGKGALGFLNGSGRQPQVIIVQGDGRYVQQPQQRTWGLARTWLLFAAIFSGGPMLTLLIMAVVHLFWAVVAWLGHNWVVPVGFLVVALVVGGVWYAIHRDRQDGRQTLPQIVALPEVAPAAPVPAQPAMGWSLSDYEGQWDAR